MGSDLRLPWESDLSASDASEGEDLEGVEYEARSIDGSESGRSLKSFFNDYGSASIQGPSFYRALNNENLVSPRKRKNQAPGYSPASPYRWTKNSAFRKDPITPLPVKGKALSPRRIPVRSPRRVETMISLEEEDDGPVLSGQALTTKRRRIIFSQETHEEIAATPRPPLEVRS